MSPFDLETSVQPGGAADAAGPPLFSGRVHAAWNIGANPNGGYLLAIVGRALQASTPQHPDPLSLTAHYLRPGLPDQPCQVQVQVLRTGRTLSTVRAALLQDGQARLEVLAAMGDLGTPDAALPPPTLTLARPELPPPEACAMRSGAAQGVTLPILDRLHVRLNPAEAEPGAAGAARISGWICHADGREPDALSAVLMADAFPPSVFGLLGMVGWVPTIELTVHLRRRPSPGWMLGQFHTQDLDGGRMIEDGALWDADGHLIVQSRQLALVRQP